MKLVPIPVNSTYRGWHFTVDFLALFAWLIILILCWVGFFPWWVVIFYPLSTLRGITMRFRLEK